MDINDEINKYKEIIIKSEYKKEKLLYTVAEYFNNYCNCKDKKDYYLNNLIQILILLETMNQSIEQTKIKLELAKIKNSFNSKFCNKLNLIENNIFINSSESQYKIELLKLIAMENMDTPEYMEQVQLVKKYRKKTMFLK